MPAWSFSDTSSFNFCFDRPRTRVVSQEVAHGAGSSFPLDWFEVAGKLSGRGLNSEAENVVQSNTKWIEEEE